MLVDTETGEIIGPSGSRALSHRSTLSEPEPSARPGPGQTALGPTEPGVAALLRPPAIVAGADYLLLPRAAETWLLEPILPVGGTLLLYGDPKVGKSFATLQLACALATASDFLSFPSPASCRVVYIQLDTPRSLWADRVGQLRNSGLATDAVWFADRETLNCWPFDILQTEHQILLHDALEVIKPDVVIIDTLKEAHRTDENNATEMQKVISAFVSTVKPAALVVVAHGKKTTADNPASLVNGNRGSNYVVGAVDGIIHMQSKGIEVGGRAVEEHTLALDRQTNGTWALNDRENVKLKAKHLLASESKSSLREKARQLANDTGRTEAACLSTLQRLLSGASGLSS